MYDFMLYFNLFIAAYVLYYAIRGQGRIYENDYPKAIKEGHAKLLRKFCWIVGLGMLPLTVLELVYDTNNQASVFSWINIGFVLAAIVTYLVIFRVKFGKYVYTKKDK